MSCWKIEHAKILQWPGLQGKEKKNLLSALEYEESTETTWGNLQLAAMHY